MARTFKDIHKEIGNDIEFDPNTRRLTINKPGTYSIRNIAVGTSLFIVTTGNPVSIFIVEEKE